MAGGKSVWWVHGCPRMGDSVGEGGSRYGADEIFGIGGVEAGPVSVADEVRKWWWSGLHVTPPIRDETAYGWGTHGFLVWDSGCGRATRLFREGKRPNRDWSLCRANTNVPVRVIVSGSQLVSVFAWIPRNLHSFLGGDCVLTQRNGTNDPFAIRGRYAMVCCDGF